MQTTAAVATPPCPPLSGPARHLLKKALYNLTHNCLSPGDFIVLVNRFGYHEPLHGFPLETLQPSDWLALTERGGQQIVRENGSFLAQLPPQLITCKLCVAAYRSYRKKLFKLIPERLKEPFYTQLIKKHPCAILHIPSKERTFERLLAACCASRWLLSRLTPKQKTVGLLIEVCRRSGYGLELIPEQNRSYDLCLQACKDWGANLMYVPERFKNDEICRLALSTYGQAYRWLPERLSKNPEWQLLACLASGAVLEWVPKEQHNSALYKAACSNSEKALKFIDADKITYEMCRLACSHGALHTGEEIPERYLDEQLRWQICSNTYFCHSCDRFKSNTACFYEKLLRKNRWATLAWVPEQYRGPIHYLLACQNRGLDLDLVPFEHRTPEVCLAACRNDVDALAWVPNRAQTAKIHQAACTRSKQAGLAAEKQGSWLKWFAEALRDDDDNNASWLITHAKRLLSKADFQSLLERSFFCTNSHKMTMLTHPCLNLSQKKQLVGWILEPSAWPAPEPPKASDLCEMASPLRFALENPELFHLALSASKVAAHWMPPRYGAGRWLLNEIERGLSVASVGLPDYREPLFQRPASAAGGRTLKVEQGAQALYYKFQRRGESLETLMREGVLHTVRESRPDLLGQLRSKLPGDSRFFRLYLDQLPEVLPPFADPPEVGKDEDGRDCLHVYRYTASTDYSLYAHRADHSQPGNPYHKGEQGILTACHDIGQFIAMGLVPTSTLPAFHDQQSDRQWLALHALFGYRKRTVYPGTFGAWNSVATEQCDFGYGGFRDLGDFEPFGKIGSFIEKTDAQAGVQVPELEQCLSVLNAVCENLLAAHLVRARLRQTGSDYHYKNPEALQQNQAFIEQSLLCFLKGMYGDRQNRDNDCRFLCERLGLDRAAYNRWLSRTALEILYWTAQQPHPEQPDCPPFEHGSSLYSHEDGYALHLNRTGRLDPDLYPDAEVHEDGAPAYPDLFHNRSGQLNLGRRNSAFPLTTLMRGLVRLCTGILAYPPGAEPLSSES